MVDTRDVSVPTPPVDDLRGSVVEAMAAAIWNDLPKYELSYPECERIARVCLDAARSYLTKYCDVWEKNVVGFAASTQVYGRAAQRLLEELGDE